MEAWNPRRVAVHGMWMALVVLLVGLLAALARSTDPFLAPFAWMLGFFAWLWSLHACIHLELRRMKLSWNSFFASLSRLPNPGFLGRFLLLATTAALALSAGALSVVFPSAVFMLFVFPLQWMGAALLLFSLPAAFLAVVAASMSPPATPGSPDDRGGLPWGDLRVWAVGIHAGLVIFFAIRSLDLVFATHPPMADLWQHAVWGPAFGKTPAGAGHGSVAALHLGVLFFLVPLQGHLAVFIARLASRAE